MGFFPVSISSSSNALIKEVKALKGRKFREDKGLFFVEGSRFVKEADESNADIQKLIFSEKFIQSKADSGFVKKLEALEVDKYVVTERLFDELTDTENPQGILAVIKIKNYDMNNFINDKAFFVIMDSIQDPGNMGTIIRTADAAGVDGIFLSRGCVDLYNPKVLRATMGSVFHVPVFRCGEATEAIDTLRTLGFKSYAAHLNGNKNYFDIDMAGKVAVIIGNEANGISEAAAQNADYMIKIPILGKAESLNAAIAASLMMYEAVRQKYL